MRSLLLLIGSLCLLGCDNQKPQKSADATTRTVVATSQPDAVTKAKELLAGRWINKDTVVDKGIISSDKTDVFKRNITLESSGTASFVITKNGRVVYSQTGRWNLQSDILYIDENNGASTYWRLLRVSGERLVIRTDEGNERIYDRIQ